MTNFGTALREPINGDYIAGIPFDAWLYFEYHQGVNKFSRCQSIFSPFHSPGMIGLMDMLNGEATDRILEVWFRPYFLAGVDNSNAQFYLDNQFLVRYQRMEHLNDGRPRDTMIGRDKMHLLNRSIILPPQDSLTAPYQPVAPWRVPPHEYISASGGASIPLGAGAWTLPVTEGYDGSFPAPPPALAGTSTAHRMAQIVHYAKTYLNINTLADITVVPPSGPAGILDHPIDLRYDNMLTVLQKMSAASWFAWYHGQLPAGILPVDFTLTPDPAAPNKWLFEVKPGGLGVDRTIGGVLGGNPSDVVILSVGNDNVIQPVRVADHTELKTRIYVGGKNDGTARDVIATVDLDRALLSPWNLIDKFIHSSKQKAFDFTGGPTDGIIEAVENGVARLREESPREEITLILRQNRTVRKGVNLAIGDIITADLFDRTDNYQIRSVRHTMSRSGGVTISFELGHLDGRYFKGSDEFQQIINRQNQIATDSDYTGEAQ